MRAAEGPGPERRQRLAVAIDGELHLSADEHVRAYEQLDRRGGPAAFCASAYSSLRSIVMETSYARLLRASEMIASSAVAIVSATTSGRRRYLTSSALLPLSSHCEDVDSPDSLLIDSSM